MLHLCQELGAGTHACILHCYAVWSSYYLLHRENSIGIRDLYKSKLQLYIDDNEL